MNSSQTEAWSLVMKITKLFYCWYILKERKNWWCQIFEYLWKIEMGREVARKLMYLLKSRCYCLLNWDYAFTNFHMLSSLSFRIHSLYHPLALLLKIDLWALPYPTVSLVRFSLNSYPTLPLVLPLTIVVLYPRSGEIPPLFFVSVMQKEILVEHNFMLACTMMESYPFALVFPSIDFAIVSVQGGRATFWHTNIEVVRWLSCRMGQDWGLLY